MEKLLKYPKIQFRQARYCLLAIIAAAVWCMGACSEFFEKSITDDSIVLLSPGADAETNTYLVNFLWEPLDHALQYRLQLASPSFDSAALFHADTTLEKTMFSTTLQPGRYEWRVRGLNGSSGTAYTTRAFTIHEAALSMQTVLQVSPQDNFITSQRKLEMEWQGIFSAKSYRLQVDSNAFADEDNLLLDRSVAGTSFAYDVLDEARHQWRVRAENDTAQSRWSMVRSFIHDRTPPLPPALTAPANNVQVNRPVSLQWNASQDAAFYRLYVYRSDSTLLSAHFPLRLETTSYAFDAGTRGERILWRVRATDRAGNESGYSDWRSFVIRN
ncbi:hypothetical protein ACFOET_06930 [Parapedobacter deserti]|uniref:Fibronectin type-III domain-containing protein n=1 Tax=Parapedobacter deserti TaxID=1912957 RepID=A0ABV7JH43_9SPHI